MGHSKYPEVAFGDWRATRGYMYAVPAGWWPTDDGTFRLRVKLGSTRSVDAVGASQARYDTLLGRTDVWWVESSADAYRDELDVLHVHFADRRVYPDRELFYFRDRAEFDREVGAFTTAFRANTSDEEPYKAAVITDLAAPNGLLTKEAKAARAAQRLEERLRRQEAQQREKGRSRKLRETRQERYRQRKLREKCERARKRGLRAQDRRCKLREALREKRKLEDTRIAEFIAEHCVMHPDGWLPEAEFNARAPSVAGGIGPVLLRKAFVRCRVQTDGQRKWGWKGMQWRMDK